MREIRTFEEFQGMIAEAKYEVFKAKQEIEEIMKLLGIKPIKNMEDFNEH